MPRVAVRGGEVRAREGRRAWVFPEMALLLLLSAVIPGWDAAVPRRKRGGHRVRAGASRWWEFSLPVPPPPARVRWCCDCGAAETPQWRCGPKGPGTLCNRCGVRRRKAGERWGVPRRPWRATATTVSDQPPQENRTDSSESSPQDGRICEPGLAPAATKRVTTPPPATGYLLAPETVRAGSELLPPTPPGSPATEYYDLASSELRVGATDDGSANNADASGTGMAGLVGEPEWLELNPFLLDGPVAPRIIEPEGPSWIFID